MRTPSCENKKDLKKGSWSLEEDNKLISYINRYGIWNWSQMPRFAGLSRSGKSCRLRWMNYLKPNVKRGNFTKEEEEIILLSHSLLGNRWSAIASRLPGRTDNDIKNYWHTHLKKRAAHIQVSETTMTHGRNGTSAFEANIDDQNTQQPVNRVNESSDTQSWRSSEDDNSTIDFKDAYYDIGSPGTVDDLQCFWKQLCPIENLELGYLFADSVFQDLDLGPWS